ncbi:MAG TPA: carboxypeptidase regulatory-like domain-containing protein, partial [Candidatus Solibacter sp.]|nr:carboxypeptidase regulatory-like domain-containing protein [Candidatus Solibacter sp.]
MTAKLLWAVLLVCTSLAAQTSTGEIDVTVQDASGAVIPKAKITITGSATGNLVRTLITSEAGLAAAPLLQPESYDVVVTADGFEKLVRRAVVLSVGDVLTLHLTLTPGSTASEITVTGQTPLVEEKSITIGQVVDEKEILELPLNGRNYLELGNLAPGAVPAEGSRDQTFSSYGNGGLQNAFLLDGARNENYLRGLDNRARDILRPPLDALSQFQVQTANYGAEFGSSAGAIVNAVTKSGTNRWHGSVYEFARNDKLDAVNYFAKGSQPLFVQNQYGASLGAPIRKNRAWVFGAYEGFHNRSETTGFGTVPTEAMRSANFGTTNIFDPLTTAPNPAGSGSVRTQFPGNVIPSNRFDSVGAKILNLYPHANQPGLLANDYSRDIPQLAQSHNSVIRGDWQLGAKDSMFWRGAITRYSLDAATNLPPPAQAESRRDIRSEGIGYGYTRVFTNTLVNELRFSWTRMFVDQDEKGPLDPLVPGLLDPAIQHGTANVSISGGFSAIGAQPGSVGNSPLRKSSGVWDISDNVSKALSKHLLKFGSDFQIIRPTTFSALNGRGTVGFTGVFTQDPQKRSGTGSGLADLILGDANSLASGTVADSVERGKYSGWYLQDQWSVAPSLTLNLGVRYEMFFPFVEVQNRMADFIVNRSDPLFGHYLIAGVNGQSRTIVARDTLNIAPRAGFVWRVPHLKDTVIRSSYGIFYAQDQGNGV